LAVVHLAVVLVSGSANAQEILITGPLKSAPDRFFCAAATPAALEWTYFAAGGANRMRGPGDASRAWGALGAVGGEATFEVLRYHGFPSGWYGGRCGRGDAELRVGPWALGATRADGGLVEGGLKLHVGGVYHASFGTWDARGGLGYGLFSQQRRPHWVVTVAYGVRGVLKRHRGRVIDELEPPRGPAVAEATIARLFLTLRRALDDPRDRELVVGAELSPTFLLPPYSWWRFAGGPPR
jgi:hypothetical protein